MPNRMRFLNLFAVLALFLLPTSGFAQGLIWSIPEEGTWVRYEGLYKQTEIREGVAAGNKEHEWIRELTIKALGTETATYKNKETTCHWLEFKLVTGKPSEAGIDPGNYGVRIYKILVPAEEVVGDITDKQDILVDYLPIVKGYRQLSIAEEAEEMTVSAFQVFPLMTLMRHYRSLTDEGETDVALRTGTVAVNRYIGSLTTESPTNRTVNKAEFWKGDDVPFGLAKWTVVLLKEGKDQEDSRGDFRRVSEINEEMSVVAIGTDAQSELETP